MARILMLTLMLSFFGFGKSKAQEKESTDEQKVTIGRYYENDLPVIVNCSHLTSFDSLVDLHNSGSSTGRFSETGAGAGAGTGLAGTLLLITPSELSK